MSNLLFNLFSALWIFSNLLQWYLELRKPMIPESQLRSARTHSTYKESLPEDELQEFEQANHDVGKVLEKSRRHEEIGECCSSSGEKLSSSSRFTLLVEGMRSTLALASLACGKSSKTGCHLIFDIVWNYLVSILYNFFNLYITQLYMQQKSRCTHFLLKYTCFVLILYNTVQILYIFCIQNTYKTLNFFCIIYKM